MRIPGSAHQGIVILVRFPAATPSRDIAKGMHHGGLPIGIVAGLTDIQALDAGQIGQMQIDAGEFIPGLRFSTTGTGTNFLVHRRSSCSHFLFLLPR